MDVPKIVVPPKSSILIGFSIINHPFWGTTIFGNTHVRHDPLGGFTTFFCCFAGVFAVGFWGEDDYQVLTCIFLKQMWLVQPPTKADEWRPFPSMTMLKKTGLGGGFKHLLFSSLLGEDEPDLTNIFQMG